MTAPIVAAPPCPLCELTACRAQAYDGAPSNCVVDDLPAGRALLLRCQCVTDAGPSPLSAPVGVCTEPAPPAAPLDLRQVLLGAAPQGESSAEDAALQRGAAVMAIEAARQAGAGSLPDGVLVGACCRCRPRPKPLPAPPHRWPDAFAQRRMVSRGWTRDVRYCCAGARHRITTARPSCASKCNCVLPSTVLRTLAASRASCTKARSARAWSWGCGRGRSMRRGCARSARRGRVRGRTKCPSAWLLRRRASRARRL